MKILFSFLYFCSICYVNHSWASTSDIIGRTNILKVETKGNTDDTKMIRFQYCDKNSETQIEYNCRYLGNPGMNFNFYSLKGILNQRRLEYGEFVDLVVLESIAGTALLITSVGGGVAIALWAEEVAGGTVLQAFFTSGAYVGLTFEGGFYGLEKLAENFRGLNPQAQYKDYAVLSNNIIYDQDYYQSDHEVILDYSQILDGVLKKITH